MLRAVDDAVGHRADRDAEKFAAGNPKLATQKIDYLQAAK